MRLLILPRYARKGASSRLRYLQFLEYLSFVGFSPTIDPLLPNEYIDSLYQAKKWPRWKVIRAILHRLRTLAGVRRFDLVWVEKEILPFFPAVASRLLRRMGIPVVVDYDDAWHLRYRDHPNPLVRWCLARKIETVMRCATLVIAGNPRLVEVARASGARKVVEVPTVLDPSRYRPASHTKKQCVRLVWIGSGLNSQYLIDIAGALATVCKANRAELVVIGGNPVPLPYVPVRYEPWSEDEEASALATADVGIMPLPDDEWARGKCAYKILQYMAASLPVVASPVGLNSNLVTSDIGFLAKTEAEWVEMLNRLIANVELRSRMGRAGRAKVERDFSVHSWGPKVAAMLAEVARPSSPALQASPATLNGLPDCSEAGRTPERLAALAKADGARATLPAESTLAR